VQAVTIDRPHRVDQATRDLFAEALRPLLVDFYGPVVAARMQPFVNKFDILDRVRIVVGTDLRDIRSWTTYTMLSVGRKPVMWIHGTAIRPGLESVRLAPLSLAECFVEEWMRHGCRPMSIAGMTRNLQLLRFFRTVWGDENVAPRRDGVHPGDTRHVTAIVGGRIVEQLRRSGATQATLDVDANIVRNAFGGDPSPEAGPKLGPHDGYLIVVRASVPRLLRQARQLPDWYRARRRAEIRIRERHAARR
jgi:hypothetical protein